MEQRSSDMAFCKEEVDRGEWWGDGKRSSP